MGVACAASVSYRRLRSNCARPNHPASPTQAQSESHDSAVVPAFAPRGSAACAAALQGQPKAPIATPALCIQVGFTPDIIRKRGTTHIMASSSATNSRTFRRASRRSSRLRVPEANSRLKSAKMPKPPASDGSAAKPPDAGLRNKPTAAPASTICISTPDTSRRSSSIRNRFSWGAGYTRSLRRSSDDPILAESMGIACQ